MKYAVNQNSEMANQEKQASYLESNVVKHTFAAKGTRELRNSRKTCYMNAIFQCLGEGASSLRSSPKQVVRKEGINLKEQVLALLKLLHNTKGKVIHPVQARQTVKLSFHNLLITEQYAHDLLTAILPLLQLPKYQGSVSSILQCESCKYHSIKKEVFSCIEVPVPEREGVASLENCLDRWSAEYKVQDLKCTSCSQCGSGVKKLVLEAVPELLITQLKRFRKVENSVEKIYKRVKFPMDKTVLGGRNYELKAVTCHSGSPVSGHYTAAVKIKERSWNYNDAVTKSMEEGKVV